MDAALKILIADRNPRVREFLQREFREAGYRTQTAKDCAEVMTVMDGTDRPALLILDLELPHGDCCQIVHLLGSLEAPVPVIVHSLPGQHPEQLGIEGAAAFVEKEGDTHSLKQAVARILRRWYPERFHAPTLATAE
jgi:DNA-binding response OmpR family regulator